MIQAEGKLRTPSPQCFYCETEVRDTPSGYSFHAENEMTWDHVENKAQYKNRYPHDPLKQKSPDELVNGVANGVIYCVKCNGYKSD